MKKALIFGVTGQDGAYLADALLKKNYAVHGVKRRQSNINSASRLDLIFKDPTQQETDFILHYGDVTDPHNVTDLIAKIRPDEIYNLAAQSHVAVSFEVPEYTANADAIGALRILEAIKFHGFENKTKFYQAGTSEMFGKVKETPQNEKTPFYPRSPYGVAKVFAHNITNHYREAYDIFACCGILFNHESPLRGIEFVTRQITYRLARIKFHQQKKFKLGNIRAKRDWGFAGDYVESMWLMLQQKNPDDYVIATGESHSVEEFLALATEYAGLGDWREYVEIDYELRPTDIDVLVGDSSKAQKQLPWKPKMKFEDLVKNMVEHDLEYFKFRSDQVNDYTD